MKIVTLIEDTTQSDFYKCEHGLSCYIEANNHKILYDLGASDVLLENAKKLDVDLSLIDTVIISHGHYDHGGNLSAFLDINNIAKIYVNKNAFNDFYSKKADDKIYYIGLDKSLKDNARIVFTESNFIINDYMMLYSNVNANNNIINSNLYVMDNNKLMPDTFNHEQYLVIRENNNDFLFSGCSHKGIENIIKHFIDLYKTEPKYVIGGYHLSNISYKSNDLIEKLGSTLNQYDTTYYTCHCTGKEAYKMLKKVLKEKINYISTGDIIDIN